MLLNQLAQPGLYGFQLAFPAQEQQDPVGAAGAHQVARERQRHVDGVRVVEAAAGADDALDLHFQLVVFPGGRIHLEGSALAGLCVELLCHPFANHGVEIIAILQGGVDERWHMEPVAGQIPVPARREADDLLFIFRWSRDRASITVDA